MFLLEDLQLYIEIGKQCPSSEFVIFTGCDIQSFAITKRRCEPCDIRCVASQEKSMCKVREQNVYRCIPVCICAYVCMCELCV